MKRLLFILALLTGAAWAQAGNTVTIEGSGAPVGACSFIFRYIDTAANNLYFCSNGSWLQANGAGGGGTVTHTVGALTAGQVVIGNGAADIKVDTGCSTNGIGTMTCVSNATSGSNGGLSGIEGTGAGLTAGAGTDLLWADSTAHRWKFNVNNTGAFLLPGIATAGTGGNCVKLASNGIDIMDNGSACAAGGSAVVTFRGTCKGAVTANVANTAGLMTLGGNTNSGACNSGSLQANAGVNTRSCTLKNLYVHAGSAGVNASDGAITVQLNGSATGITCTIGTGTSCNDTTHSAASVAGDQVWTILASQAGSGLADLSASMECQ